MSSSYTLLPFEAQRAFVHVISEVADAIKKGVDSIFLVKREEGRVVDLHVYSVVMLSCCHVKSSGGVSEACGRRAEWRGGD